MTARILDGRDLTKRIKQCAQEDIVQMSRPPKLVSLLIGADKGAVHYAKVQKRECEQIGIQFILQQFSGDVSQNQVETAIEDLNRDPSVTGIMLFIPVPEGIQVDPIIRCISPQKDVEGITPTNMGKLFYGDHSIAPCTPKATLLLLETTGVSLASQEIVVVSHNPIVGQALLPMLLCSKTHAPTPTCCHIATRDLSFHTRRADILIVAAGVPGLIQGDMIKPRAVVLDVGINLVDNGGKKSVVGDVDFASAEQVASWLTPVPGGVGPVTTAVLLQNVVTLAKRLQ